MSQKEKTIKVIEKLLRLGADPEEICKKRRRLRIGFSAVIIIYISADAVFRQDRDMQRDIERNIQRDI